MISGEKKLLRKHFLNIRNGIKRNSAGEVKNTLKNNIYYNEAKKIFCYVSAGSEPETNLLLEEILKSGKTLAVPRCLDKKGNMAAIEIRSLDVLEEGCFGIKEPKEGRVMERKDFDLCIVPGLAFDGEGRRLGYGGGYYDRFLEGGSVYSIGLCFKECKAEKLPAEENDVPVNEVIFI